MVLKLDYFLSYSLLILIGQYVYIIGKNIQFISSPKQNRQNQIRSPMSEGGEP
jgi:hypothetical protein